MDEDEVRSMPWPEKLDALTELKAVERMPHNDRPTVEQAEKAAGAIIHEANQWECCAIGEALSLKEQEWAHNELNGELGLAVEQCDPTLAKLGRFFTDAVETGDTKTASTYRSQIRKRVQALGGPEKVRERLHAIVLAP